MVDESKLIFIISQPRSGSTLLQKLVSNNPAVDTVSEPWLLLPLLSVFKPELIEAKYNYPVAMEGFHDYLKKKNGTEDFKKKLKQLILDLYKVDDNLYFVDKTPRYYEILKEIFDFFPSAKFLILKRNPFASLHSMLATWSGDKFDYKFLNTFYRDFLIAPFLIQEFLEKNKSSSNILEVKYENIVLNPSEEMKAIYEWLNIPFEADVLKIDKNDKVKGMYGDDVYKKEPLKEIKSAKADLWKESLSDKKRRQFFSQYQEYLSIAFINKYGYSAETFQSSSSLFGGNEFKEYVSYLKKNNRI